MNTWLSMAEWRVSIIGLATIVLAALAFSIYRWQLPNAVTGTMAWLLPALRSLTVAIVALTLFEPALQRRTQDGELSRLVFLLDTSQSMSIKGEQAEQPAADRFTRAQQLLWGEGGWLKSLQRDFDVRVVHFDQRLSGTWWRGPADRALAELDNDSEATPVQWGTATALGDTLAACLEKATQASATSLDGEAASEQASQRAPLSLVLLSDGAHNSGSDPLSVAKQLQAAGIQVFAIGFGRERLVGELALLRWEVPARVVRSDTLQGRLSIVQREARGTRFTVSIDQAGQSVWQADFIADEQPEREIELSLPVESLFARGASQFASDTEITSLPIKLTARLIVANDQQSPLDRSLDAHTLIAAQRARVLLIDGRSRWETRYLKNMFQRDPNWHLDTLITSQFAPNPGLPQTVTQFQDYDLVILGEVEAELLSPEFLSALRDTIERGGCGLIVVDGARGWLRDPRLEILQRLLPIDWISNTNGSPRRTMLTTRPRLTSAGEQLDALRLQSDQAASAAQWDDLPELEVVTRVRPLPGAEVLLEAANEVDSTPLLVTRPYGAGRVLYSASDETWRWRYELAEQVHSRLWLQLARWLMRAPFSLHGQYVSLDTGQASYTPGQTIPVRCQLRRPDGTPAPDMAVSLLISSGERLVSLLPLRADTVAGNYSGDVSALPEGEYRARVVVPGYSAEALGLQSQFSVVAPPSPEMWSTACDSGLLQAIAAQTGGGYVPENAASDLPELLQPLVRGRIRTLETLLWPTYWWLTLALLPLLVEWLLRKRLGLL